MTLACWCRAALHSSPPRCSGCRIALFHGCPLTDSTSVLTVALTVTLTLNLTSKLALKPHPNNPHKNALNTWLPGALLRRHGAAA